VIVWLAIFAPTAFAATIAYAPMESLAVRVARPVLLALSGVIGCLVGALIPTILLFVASGLVLPAALAGIIPAAFVGACCGFLLPPFLPARTAG